MRKKPSLSLKVLALVLCPLALQLILLIWIAKLESEADAQLELSIKAEKISESISRLSTDIFEFASTYSDEAALSEAGNTGAFARLQDRVVKRYEYLRSLTYDQKDLDGVVIKSEQAMHRMVDIAHALKNAPTSQSDADRRYRKPLWHDLRVELKNILYAGMLDMAKQQKSVAQISKEDQTSLRAFSQKVAMAGAILTIILAGVIAFYFLKNVTRRLNVLNDNALRLASGMPLQEKLPGADDIAFLDSTFHAMAAALQESIRKEKAVVNNARDFICSIDNSGRFTAANPASVQLLGRTPEELLGSNFADCLAEERYVATQFMEDLIRLGDRENVDLPMKRSDGVIVHTVWSAHWSKEENVASCVIHDVSERYAAQQLRQELVAMITHDLRTPLTTMSNVFVLLGKGDRFEHDKEAQGLAKLGTRQVDKMAQLVNDLLDIDKINSGQMNIDASKILLDECFAACVESLTLLAGEKEIALEFDTTDLVVVGEEEKVDRILTNLVANAIKYSPRGGRIHVCAKGKDEYAYISVEDQGRGIPQEQFETVFQRFRQVDGAVNQGGSGLGLAICKAFVELHKGKIWVECSSAKGTTFMFTIPLATTQASVTTPS